MHDLSLTIHQTAPLLGEVAQNQEEVLTRIRESEGRDLLAFPELAITGYSLKSRIQRFAVPEEELPGLRLPEGSPAVALGLPERGRDELVYNTALLVQEDRILAKHRKVYLPTYGLFDESRYFAAGREPPPVVTLPGGWKVGLLVCEDLWHPGLLYLLAMQGAEVVLALSAAPGRGDPGEDEDRPLFSSTANWTLLARTAAMQYGIFLVVVNRGGVEGGVTFAGESMAVDPEGTVLARAPQAVPCALHVTLSRQALRSARNPYSHLRDEDPSFLKRGLDRLLDGS
jgi:predicted amidohydrolase